MEPNDKINLISFSETRGGAAKATRSLYNALLNHGVNVHLIVAEAKSEGSIAVSPGKLQSFMHFLLRLIAFALGKALRYKGASKLSFNFFSSSFVVKKIFERNYIHINWVNNETVSLDNLAKICESKKVIITLHDEWLYNGIEHCSDDIFNSNPEFERVNHSWLYKVVNNVVFNKKKSIAPFLKNAIYTVPSRWMLNRARNSEILNGCDIRLIPNIIDTRVFRKKQSAYNDVIKGWRENGNFIILFGAINVESNMLKGGALLYDALKRLDLYLENNAMKKIKLVTFGGTRRGQVTINGFEVFNVGHVTSSEDMATLYSSCSITAVPSLTESFGQVAAESLACETPVLCFECTGLKDIVSHRVNGYLAKSYSSDELSKGIVWLANMHKDELENYGRRGRASMKKNFSAEVVTGEYIKLYSEFI